MKKVCHITTIHLSKLSNGFQKTQYKIQTPFILNLSISHSLALVSHTTIISVHCLFASFIFSLVLGISVHAEKSVLPFASHWYLYFCHTNYDTVFKNTQEVHFFFLSHRILCIMAHFISLFNFLKENFSVLLKILFLHSNTHYPYTLLFFSLYQLLPFNIIYLYICYFLRP